MKSQSEEIRQKSRVIEKQRRVRKQYKKGECEMNYLVEKTGIPVQNNCDTPIRIEPDGSITIVADQIILESDK